MIYRLITWLLCGVTGAATAYLVVSNLPLPDSARSLVGLLVTIGATSLYLWLYRERRAE